MSQFTDKYTLEQVLEAAKKNGWFITAQDGDAIKTMYEAEKNSNVDVISQIFENIMTQDVWYAKYREQLIGNISHNITTLNMDGRIKTDLEKNFSTVDQKQLDETYEKIFGKKRPLSTEEIEEAEKIKGNEEAAADSMGRKTVGAQKEEENIEQQEENVPKNPEPPYVDTATPEEKVKRLEDIYYQQHSIEGKLRFLSDAISYVSTLHEKHMRFLEEFNKITELLDAFQNSGEILALDTDTPKQIFETLGNIKGKLSIEFHREYKKLLKTFPANDPHREEKAYRVTKLSSEPGLRSTYFNINVAVSTKDTLTSATEEIKRKYKLDADTTMEDMANYCDYNTPEELEKFLKFFKTAQAKATDKVIDIFRKEQPGVPDDQLQFKMYSALINTKVNHWIQNGIDHALNESKLSPAEKKIINEQSKRIGVDKSSPKAVNDWLENKAIADKLAATAEENFTNIIHSFQNTYIKGYEHTKSLQKTAVEQYRTFQTESVEQYRTSQEEAAPHKRLKTAQAYPEFFEWNDNQKAYTRNHLAPQKVAALRQDFSFDMAKMESDRLRSQMQLLVTEENQQILQNGWGCNRPDSMLAVFDIWALGTHPEIDANEVTALAHNQALREEFVQFCKKNPARNPESKEKYEEYIKNWADALKRGTERVKQITLPDVDYSNPVNMKNTMMLQMKIRSLYINFSQEKDRMFGANKYNINAKRIVSEHLGEKNYEDMLAFWSNLQNFHYPFNSAYILEPFSGDETTEQITEQIYKVAISRALLVKNFKNAKGKTLDTALKEFGNKNYYYCHMTNALSDMYSDGDVKDEYAEIAHINRKEAIKYLNGKDTKSLEKKLDKLVTARTHHYEKEYMLSEITTSVKTLREEISFGDAKDTLLNLPGNVQSILDFLNSGEALGNVHGFHAGILPKDWLSTVMNKIFSENYTRMIRDAGFKQSDMFLVDGKTAEELWGEKYADFHLDDKTKENCYKVEFLKKFVEGNSEIRFKNIVIGKDEKLHVDGSICLMKSSSDMQKLKTNLAIYQSGIEKLQNELQGFQNDLLSTHENANNLQDEIGQVGSNLFQKMEITLDEAIEALGDDELTAAQVSEKLAAFKTAANEYYKNRKSIFDKRSEKAQTRLDTSEAAKNVMPDILINYQELVKNISSDLCATDDYTFANAPIRSMKDTIEKMETDALANSILKLSGVNVDEEQMSHLADNVRNQAHERNIMTQTITKGLDKLGKNYSNMLKSYREKSNPDTYEMAVLYKINTYLYKMDAKGIKAQNIKDMHENLQQSFENDSFKKEAEKLSKNPVFQVVLKENKHKWFEKWSEIEKTTRKYIVQQQKKLRDLRTENGDIIHYIMTGNAAENQVGNQAENQQERLTQQYQRLATVITQYILSDSKQQVILNAIAAKRMSPNEVYNQTLAKLTDKHVLEGRHFNEDRLRHQLNSGELKDKVVESIKKQYSQNVKNPAPRKNTAKSRNPMEVPKIR